MKYNLDSATLLMGTALWALSLIPICAADFLDEDWHEQDAGNTVDALKSWKKMGKSAAENGQIVVLPDGTKVLEIKATSDQPFDGFGITAQDAFDWKDSLEVSLKAAFSAAENSSLPAGYLPSFIIMVSGGTVTYQINVRPNHIQIGKYDPDHPNPDEAARDRNFTVLFKSPPQQDPLTSSDLHDFKLKMKRSSNGIELTLLQGQDETELGTITDTTPANIGEMVNVGIDVENYAILKIGQVKITAH